jgi:hypothetical protein
VKVHATNSGKIIKVTAPHNIVTVEEDYRGGTASEESDVTSITIGRKGTAVYC